MGHFKSFMLGVGFAFGIYYLTKKDAEGKCMLDEILDNPKKFAENAKDYAIEEAVHLVKEL
jgi:hypothetical protein